MITQNSTLNVDGAVIFWSVKKTEHDLLCSKLCELDLQDFTPDPRGTVAILKDALGEVFGGGQFMIRPLESKDGYSIVRETKGNAEKAPEFEHVGTITVTENGNMTFDLVSFEEEQAIREAYDVCSGHVTGSQVTSCLIKILTRFGGITLRPSGAVYWLPVEALPEWNRVVKAVEDSAVDGQTSMVHVMQVKFDESSVRAIAEGLVEEVTAEADEIVTQIKGGKIKDATLKRKLEQATRLRTKVEAYEAALGKSLSTLHDKLNEVTTVQAVGTLMSQADQVAAVA